MSKDKRVLSPIPKHVKYSNEILFAVDDAHKMILADWENKYGAVYLFEVVEKIVNKAMRAAKKESRR